MKKILGILLVAFVLIQFFPIDQTNPAPTPQMDFLNIKKTPESTAKLIRSSCYDCHSNETKYLWYANIQPVGWFLKNHIDEGRQKLNFSTFANYEPKKQAHQLDEAAEMVEKGEMPMDSYVIIHSDAKLNDAQKQELIKYFKLIASDTRILNHLPAEAEKE
ncbi:heme-binding domain-containing protein [Chryseobacterium koreense]